MTVVDRVPGSTGLPGVWADLVGQSVVVDVLARAAAAAARVGDGGSGNRSEMTQTWLLTGPPGSGRSTAGRAFAAALECTAPAHVPDTTRGTDVERVVYGCGACNPCRTVRAGTHPDVLVVATETLSLKVKDIRGLVRDAAMSPTSGRWLVVVLEDADRLTDDAADALLKSVEEPPPHTVWVLCAPTVDDVPPTIRSRARHLRSRPSWWPGTASTRARR